MSADPLRPFRRRADEAVERAIAGGAFDGLPGAGRPLRLAADDPFVPDDLRLAFKIMRDAGVAPDWMALAREIEAAIGAARAVLDEHRARLRRARETLPDGRAGDFADRFHRLSRLHGAARDSFEGSVREIQRKIDRFNFIAPEAVPRFAYWPTAELAGFDACWPWAAVRPAETGD